MYFIYSLVLGLGFLILLPRFLFDAFRHGKYVAGLRERMGSLSPAESEGRPVVWIHCVSVGETQAARPLVKAIKNACPNHAIVVSTITLTGQTLAREVFKYDVEKVFYFPFDWRWVVRKTLNAITPSTVLIMETELWPGFLRECAVRQIPVAIVNGRLSEQSYRRYRWIKPFISRVLSSIDFAIMQTKADAVRLRALGMNANRTFVSGNMKFDAGNLPVNASLTAKFRERFKLVEGAPLILAASTHPPEEVIMLNALRQIISRTERQPRLLLAPRHPERFAEVADLIVASGFRWSRRTAATSLSDRESDVILLDSIGELQSLYSLASLVFVGGSIAKTGGHSIVEPAATGACVITGPHTHNFEFIMETFVKAGAIVQLSPMSDSAAIIDLADVISQLLADPARRRELGQRAKRLVAQNRGATTQTVEWLRPILSISPKLTDRVSSLRAKSACTE